jgi:hypothetical protein
MGWDSRAGIERRSMTSVNRFGDTGMKIRLGPPLTYERGSVILSRDRQGAVFGSLVRSRAPSPQNG